MPFINQIVNMAKFQVCLLPLSFGHAADVVKKVSQLLKTDGCSESLWFVRKKTTRATELQ